jgi:hypothetical protein
MKACDEDLVSLITLLHLNQTEPNNHQKFSKNLRFSLHHIYYVNIQTPLVNHIIPKSLNISIFLKVSVINMWENKRTVSMLLKSYPNQLKENTFGRE